MSMLQNRDTQYWQDLDRKHHLHAFADMGELHRLGSKMIERAEGVYVYDTDGRQYLDGMSGLWCVNMGYSQPSLISAAIEQLQKMPYYHSFFKCATTSQAELAAKVAEVTPEGLDHLYFSGSGSEANDTVVRVVRHFWKTQGYENKTLIISRHNAYHGSTIAGLSLGGMAGMHTMGGPLLSDIVHIPQPYWYKEGGEMSPGEFGLACAQELEKTILEHGAERVAAFIGEPVQGAGGVIIPPDTYWPEIQRICQKYDILLIADEVICGFGRTGNWFGSQTLGISPDLMTIAKGLSSGYLPISGVVVNNRLADAVMNEFGEFTHGYTYGGHPVSAQVAIANIDLMHKSSIIEILQKQTIPYFQAMVQRLGEHPMVGASEGIGMLAGFAPVRDKEKKLFFPDEVQIGALCRDACYAEGLIMRAVGSRLVLSPPLIISESEIDEMEEKIMRAFDAVWKEQHVG